MVTILVVYSNKKNLSPAEMGRLKKYSFNTESDVKVGDMIKSPEYTESMVIAEVFDTCYRYYNSVTGDLTIDRPANSNVWKIRELVIGHPDTTRVYAEIV